MKKLLLWCLGLLASLPSVAQAQGYKYTTFLYVDGSGSMRGKEDKVLTLLDSLLTGSESRRRYLVITVFDTKRLYYREGLAYNLSKDKDAIKDSVRAYMGKGRATDLTFPFVFTLSLLRPEILPERPGGAYMILLTDGIHDPKGTNPSLPVSPPDSLPLSSFVQNRLGVYMWGLEPEEIGLWSSLFRNAKLKAKVWSATEDIPYWEMLKP